MADPTAPEDQGLPLADIALDMVRRAEGGPEKYVIHDKGPEVLRAAVQVVLLSGEAPAAMAPRFRGVIALCYVLSEKERSPKAAEILAEALFADPKVMQILGHKEKAARQRKREYRKFLDDKDLSRAPNIADRAPKDALKLSSFLSPGQQDMMSRARRQQAQRGRVQFREGGPKPGAAKPAPSKSEGAAPSKGKSTRRLPPGARKA